MPRRCSIPGCNSNYDSVLKGSNKCESTFAFPKDKNKCEKWLKAIPRKDWTPTKCSVVCAKHFHDSDIIRYHEFTLPSGENKKILLKYPKLSESAIPRQFDNLPKYLSSAPAKKRTNPEERRETILHREEQIIEDFLHNDIITDFDDLANNFKTKLEIQSWEAKIVTKNNSRKLYFYNLDIDQYVTVMATIAIEDNLMVKVYLKDNQLAYNDLKWILPWDVKLQRWSQLSNLLSRYKTNTVNKEVNVIEMLKEGLKIISDAYLKCENNYDESNTFLYSKHLEIIIDQLYQIVSNKNKYRPSTIIMAFILYSQSPTCYNVIRDFFVLPHKRYLQSISSSLAVSPKEENNNKNYLLNIVK